MDGTTSEHGGSGAGGGSAPAGPVEVPAAEQNVTQVVITTRTLWRGVGVILATVAGLWAVNQARGLASMLVISLFFALALVPGVNHLHQKRGWKRGAAVGFIYLVGILVLVLLTLVLIPNIAQLAERVGQDGTRWLTSLDRWTSDTFGIHIVSAEASRDAAVTIEGVPWPVVRQARRSGERRGLERCRVRLQRRDHRHVHVLHRRRLPRARARASCPGSARPASSAWDGPSTSPSPRSAGTCTHGCCSRRSTGSGSSS